MTMNYKGANHLSSNNYCCIKRPVVLVYDNSKTHFPCSPIRIRLKSLICKI